MLSIRILSGERKDETLDLPEISVSQGRSIALREDEALHFKVVLDEYFENLSLVLHEIETPYTQCYRNDSSWIYEWTPKETYGRKECFFHNYYGLAELQLVARDLSDSSGAAEFHLFIEFQPVEVFAKKINAERVEKMLSFLARQDGKDLASAVRVTRIRAGHKTGGKTETFLLERIENNVAFLKSILPSILAAPLSRLQQSTKLVAPNHDTLIDEVSLSWISENPDNLFKTFSIDEAVLSHGGEYFSSSKLLESRSENSTDIYENQVLHGFVFTIITALNKIRSKLLLAHMRESISTTAFTGYVSLFSQINKFSSIINKNKVERCTRLMRELSSIYGRLRHNVPVSKPCLDTPRFTQKSKFNLLYRQVFARSIAWRRYGAPDWSFQDELFSIQSIPKLFEYYLLCVVKYHIESGISGSTIFPVELTGEPDIFEYENSEGRIRLMYEPDIWTVGHASAAGRDLVNTEGWTVYYSGGGPRISKRGSVGGRANRCPDIILQIISKGGSNNYIIIDAKYTDSSRAFLNYLPELTMKYVHGIHRQNSGINPTIALMIVNPSEQPATRHFHQYDYSIYGKYPATPALLVSSIDVSCAHDTDSNLRRDLTQIIENIHSCTPAQ
jgi:hypothetical protein